MSWIYLTGRGHSGSTIMDIILGNSDCIDSYGEIVASAYNLDRLCSCGKKIRNCEFWSKIINDYNESGRDWEYDMLLINKHTNVKYLSKIFIDNKLNEELYIINKKLYSLLSKNNCYVLDSSKEPTRALFLLKFFNDTKVIHLIKNPLFVVNSYKKRYLEQGYFNFLRKQYYSKSLFPIITIVISISWVLGNLLIECYKVFYSERIIKVRYEDFIDDYVNSLEKISSFIECDLTDIEHLSSDSKPFSSFHNIGGNNVRMQKDIVMRKISNKTILNKLEKLIVKTICYFLMKIYNY